MGLHVGSVYGTRPVATNGVLPADADTTTPANGAGIWVGNAAAGQIMQAHSRVEQLRDEGQTWGFPQPAEYNYTSMTLVQGKGSIARLSGTSIPDLLESNIIVVWRQGFPYVGASLNLHAHIKKCMEVFLEFTGATRIT